MRNREAAKGLRALLSKRPRLSAQAAAAGDAAAGDAAAGDAAAGHVAKAARKAGPAPSETGASEGASAATDAEQPATARQPPNCPSVLFLGTGAAAPSKRRGCTGIYVGLPQDPAEEARAQRAARSAAFDWAPRAGMLVDCGEGSLGALCRRFGSGVEGRLLGLTRVWISHVHADHHAGLCSVLLARAHALAREHGRVSATALKAGCQRAQVPAPAFPVLAVVADEPVRGIVLDTIASLEASGVRVWACCVAPSTPLPWPPLHSFFVRHCHRALGLRAELGPATSVVFSGDTVPCRAVVEQATGCTMLIHEATFSDAMAEDASRKRHSTVGGALGVARQARPGVTVLTHFSQRYSHMTSAAKIADSADSSAPGSGPVLLALDGMQLPVDAPQCIALASQVRRVYRVVCARSHE